MALRYTTAFVTIATHHLPTLVQFYHQLFGLAPATQIPGVYAEFHLLGLRLGIFKPRQAEEKVKGKAEGRGQRAEGKTHHPTISPSPPFPLPLPSSSVALCLEVENLEQAIAHLTSLGFPPASEILLASHGREIYACDPDGNRLILHESK